ncbi:MAG TPA: hypothetical protein VG815_09790, partial [Chloroflexota bacterium]|nr:hypothetical protein [Chloroflexota bacterium]
FTPAAGTAAPPGSPVFTYTIVQQALAQNIPLLTLNAQNAGAVQMLAISDDAKARISAALGQGLVVVVPQQAVTIDGAAQTAWYQINPSTGETIGVTQDGEHSGIIQLSATQVFAISLAAGAFFSFSTILGANASSNLYIGGPLASVGVLRFLFAINPLAASVGFALGLVAAFLAKFAGLDPQVPPALVDVNGPTLPSNTARVAEQVPAGPPAAGAVTGTMLLSSLGASGQQTTLWTSTATSAFQAFALNAGAATVMDADGKVLGTGTVTLSGANAVSAQVTGSAKYSVTGLGSLSFYGPSESSLGVSGVWENYVANITGNDAITLTVPTGALMTGKTALPAGTYTITTSSATISGSGSTSSPNFSGLASITATNSTIIIGPGTGTLSAGGKPLDPEDEHTLDGYAGTISVSASGDGTDSVSLDGGASNVLQVTTSPSTRMTDQNTPITIATSIQTSLADTYNLTANAPAGWTVSIDSSGNVTATPAPGLQSGTYPIQIIAESQTDANLVAQTIVDVTITATQPAIALTIRPHSALTVPFNGAQLPTAFQAVIQNLGPAADTYNLTFSNLPTGFAILNSGTSVTLPAGETGILGIYLQPNAGQPIPPVGTQVSFTVTATSTSDSSITQTVTETFTVPAIDSVSVSSSPTSLSSSPGVAASTTVTLQNDGNVSETVTLSATTPTGVSASGLTTLTLAAGATQTETLTLTPATSVALNQSLATTITATYGPTASPLTTTDELDMLVTSPQAAAVSQASIAAGSANNSPLASVLSDFSNTLSMLQAATSGPLFTEAQNDLANMSKLLNADPALEPFVTQLQPIITAANAGNLAGILTPAQALFQSIAGVLAVEATEQFTVTLTPVEADLDLGQGETLSVALTDTGTDPETLNLSAGALPSGVSVSFGQNSVSLTPNQSILVPVTLTQTLQSTTYFELNVTAAATVAQHTDSAMIAVRPSVADVLSVTVSPETISSGAPVTVSAQVFNTANVSRNVQAQVAILDGSGNVVGTPTDVPVTLVPGSGDLSLSLGQVSTAGLGNGVYAVKVSLLTGNGSPLPGQSSQSDFEIGQPVTASVAASAAFVPPGSSTVTSTITVTNNNTAGPPTLAVAPYDNIQVFYASNESQNIFGVGNVDGAIFAIENASTQNITDGVLSINPPGGPSDSFNVGTVPAGKLVLVEPGISNDGGTNHTFFKVTGTLLDESEDGPNSDNTQFEFTGMQDGIAIDSGVFTPAATEGPSNDGKAQSVNFLGGPGDADSPSNDVFGPKVVATFAPQSGTSTTPSPITVEVGYADDLRRNPFYPNPWNGSPNTIFVGENSSNNEDSGAIRIINNQSTSITVNDVSVTLASGAHYDLWGSNVIPAGDSLILSQTNGQNFDSSDGDVTLPYPQTYPDGETLHAAQINIKVDGVLLPTFLDTGHVLTTGGSDPGGAGVNESENWRTIGTTGEDNPGGQEAAITVTHNLPASGYQVDSSSITPTPTSSSPSLDVWNAQLLAGADQSQFQLTGTVNDMAPGEVRQISLGTTVTTTVSVGLPTNQLPVYVTDFSVPGIVEVDPSTGAVTTVDNTGFALDSLVFDNNGDIIYTGFGNNELGMYDPSTKQNRVVATLPSPADLALDQGGNSVVVNCPGDQTIERVNLTTGAVTVLATGIVPGSTVGGIAYDNEGHLFVADNNVAGSSLLQLDPQTGAVLQTILVHAPGDLDGMTFDPVTNAFWIAVAFNHTLIQVSDYLATPQVQEFPSPSGFAASSFDGIESDGQGNIFIAEYNARVDKYSIATNTFTALTGALAADDVAPLVGNGSQELTTTISLPPLTVAAEHIIRIDPPSQTV